MLSYDPKTETMVHDPGNELPIETLFVVLSIDENANEGICALNGMPLVCGYERNASKMLEMAQVVAKTTGKKVKLVKFRREQ